MILKTIDEVKTDIYTLKTKLNRVDCPAPATSQPGGSTDQSVLTGNASHSDMAAANNRGESSENLTDHDDNDSVMTVDDNTPELSDEESLNFQVPTT